MTEVKSYHAEIWMQGLWNEPFFRELFLPLTWEDVLVRMEENGGKFTCKVGIENLVSAMRRHVSEDMLKSFFDGVYIFELQRFLDSEITLLDYKSDSFFTVSEMGFDNYIADAMTVVFDDKPVVRKYFANGKAEDGKSYVFFRGYVLPTDDPKGMARDVVRCYKEDVPEVFQWEMTNGSLEIEEATWVGRNLFVTLGKEYCDKENLPF